MPIGYPKVIQKLVFWSRQNTINISSFGHKLDTESRMSSGLISYGNGLFGTIFLDNQKVHWFNQLDQTIFGRWTSGHLLYTFLMSKIRYQKTRIW